MQDKKPRLYILDLLRGVAVFLMLLAHAVYFFHNRDSTFVLGLEKIGNTFCFVTFLLVSGAASYVAYLSQDQYQHNKKRIINKILLTLFSYYLIAIFVQSKDIIFADSYSKIKIISEILSLQLLPSYTEYIVPFIIFPLLLVLFAKYFAKISRSLGKIILVSTLFYLAGYILYHINFPQFLIPWKALLAGNDGYYRFPIFQYLPVYLLGLYWGKNLLLRDNLNSKKTFTFQFALFFGVATILIAYFGASFGLDSKTIFLRWPPAIGFITLGLCGAFALSSVLYSLHRLNRAPVIRDFFLLLGQNAFAFFWAQILLLSLYKMLDAPLVSSPWLFVIFFLIFLFACFIIATILPFNLKFSVSFARGSKEDEEELLERSSVIKFEEELAQSSIKEIHWLRKFFFPRDNGTLGRKRIIKKRHILAGVVIGLIVAIIISPLVIREVKTSIKSRQSAYWYNDSYAYRQNFRVNNLSSLGNIAKGEILSITINHQKMVQENQAKIDGSDIEMMYFDGKKYHLIPYSISNAWNQNNTILKFASAELISGGSHDSAYYLYFGNYSANDSATDINKSEYSGEYDIDLANIANHSVMATVSKRWNLIDDKGIGNSMKIYAKTNIDLVDPSAHYQIINTAINKSLKFTGEEFEGELNVSGLTPGTYQLQVTVDDNGNKYLSQIETFFVSYPLYVSWTIDWEGYDANNNYIRALDEISNKYNVPMTHFFNPRIYTTTTISPERAQYLTDWLKARLAKDDGFGLHLHMFNDFVEASGLSPKQEPRWGSNSDGYDILTSAYNSDELKQLITKAKSEFQNQSLPEADIYRAGGWFASLETLKALDDLGFKADSSGRTSYKFGSKNAKGFWDLSATTEPYQPSKTDQNNSSINNSFSLLEIPNNGADSYWFSASEMIDRFKANYSGNALKEKQQITYLSHPHWFKDAEQNKIKELFYYLSQYNNSDDRGPVVYTTTNQIYNLWTR